MTKRLLVMDIGGSKTRLRIQDTAGNIFSEFVTTGLAAAKDSDAPLPALENILKKIDSKESIVCAAVNLGGKNTEQVRAAICKVFPAMPIKIFRESEGTAAYALGEKYGAPIILMAGTGAIAVGHSEKGFITTGGWGANIGDGGSGYDIGLQAIRMSLSALDDVAPLSPMIRALCGLDSTIPATPDPSVVRDIRDKVRANLSPFERQHIAAFTKTVADFAEMNDPAALQLFDDAGKKLSELVIKTAKKLDTVPATVVVTGGLINARKFWEQSFEAALPGFTIYYVHDGLLYGTYLIAKDLYEKGDTGL